MRSGLFSKLPQLPAILGKEAAGIIVKIGNMTGISKLKMQNDFVVIQKFFYIIFLDCKFLFNPVL